MLTGRYEADVAREQLVLIDIRLPRMLLGMFVGAALAVAGAMMQGMFRNPLADPGLIGVSSGAALAAVATIALGNSLAAPWIKTFGAYALPMAAFVGGIATTMILVAIVSRQGQMAVSTLLLAGIALAALNGALMGLIAYSSDDRELRDLTLWMLGSLSGASWPKVFAIIPFALLVALVLPRLIRGLNGLLLGEAEAFHLGIDVERTKRAIVLVTSAAVGAAVAVSGILGFVGIVVPHLVRLLGRTRSSRRAAGKRADGRDPGAGGGHPRAHAGAPGRAAARRRHGHPRRTDLPAHGGQARHGGRLSRAAGARRHLYHQRQHAGCRRRRGGAARAAWWR